MGLLGQPSLLDGRLVLGMALGALGRHDEVLQEMRVALETDPQSALAWLMKGEALLGRRDLEQAELALLQAQSLDPSNPKAQQLLDQIAHARASGVEGVAIEATGTKEYPARAAADIRWTSGPSMVDAAGVPGPYDSLRDLAAPTQENTDPSGGIPGRIARSRDGEEETSIDPEEDVGAWPPAPDTAPVFAPPVSSPERTVAAPPSGARPASVHVAGPEEATMFGGPRKIADPIDPPTPLAAPMPSRSERATKELAGRNPAAAETLLPGRLPSSAQTMLADRLPPRAPEAPAIDMRRRDKATIEQRAAADSASDALVGDGRADPAPARVTKLVAAMPRELEEPRSEVGFLPPSPGGGDSAISLSAHEIVFVPTPEDDVSLDVTPLPPATSASDSGGGLEQDRRAMDSFGGRTDDAGPRAKRRREGGPPPPVRNDPPPQFVAPVPLQGMVSVFQNPEPAQEPQPRAPSARETQPAGRRKAPHLAHSEPIGVGAKAGAAPRPRLDRPSARRSSDGRRSGLVTRALDALQLSPNNGPRNWLAVVGVVAAMFATAVVAGLLVREWRLRIGVERRHELAAKKLMSGNYPGYQAAEVLYRQILAERDDKRAATLRAKVLAQLSFEFGEPPETAQRAAQALGAANGPEEREARIYLALAKGELELAARQASALVKDHPGPQARYLLGQAYLLLDQPEDAAAALHTAAAEDPQNPLILHALGLAEAALRHNDRAFDAYGKALTANANHVATIIDRALLQLRQGVDREAATGSLEGVVGKLVGDASPGQLARAYVGLAEIELGKGNVAAARSALSSAAARRRDHPLLLEELAKAYADAFELDPAEREARRALAVSGRLTPRLILAEVALRRSRPVQALTALEEVGSARPEALVLRAQAKLDLGRNDEARADAELAMRLDPTLISAAVALARVDIAEGHLDAARARLEALETQGKYAEVGWALGQVYLARKQPDRARTCFREALHRQPLLLQARLALARLLHDGGQLGEARDEVTKILATNAAFVPARRELAALALDMGDAVAARDEFDALAERDADLDTLLGSARARLLLADARGAAERVERALRMRPSGADLEAANCLKARALLADHRANEAIQLLLKVVPTAAKGEATALFIEAYLDWGRPDWAERAIGMAPVVSRTGVELTLAKARLALEQARQSAGKALAEEALARLRSGRSPVWLRAQALALVGRAEFELGNARAAWKSLKSALELDPRNVRAQYQLGLAALELKRPEDAVSAFEGALANDARFADAQFHLGRTRRELADPRADESLRAYLELEPRGALADEARRLLRGEPVTPTSDRPQTLHRGH